MSNCLDIPMVTIYAKYPLSALGKKMLAWCKKNLPRYRLVEEESGEVLEMRDSLAEFIRENSVSYTEDNISDAELRAILRSGSFMV